MNSRMFAYMHIKSFLQKGEFHPVFCEDFLFHTNLRDEFYVASVMDGCSMGKDSHFASSLFAKVLRKVVKELGYKEFFGELAAFEEWDLGELGKYILQNLWEELRLLKSQLHLDQLELLTTLLLALVDVKRKQVYLIVIGDGFFVAEGKITELDQDNRPDYLAYHLSKDFESWYPTQKYLYFLEDIDELIIATDGIGSFEKLDKSKRDFQETPEAYLLLDKEFADLPKGFDKKIEKLKADYGLIATDDVGIIEMKW
ncbi:MAG: protein phosphatase 2C domain-containing protein [Bacteroidota bacterium]